MLLGCIFTVLPAALTAQPVYDLDPRYPVHPLDDQIEIVGSERGDLSWQELLRDSTLKWNPLRDMEGYAPPDKVYYGRFRLRPTDSLSGWQFILEDRLYSDVAWIRGNGRVDVWAVINDSLLWHRVTGADVPPDQRDLTGHRWHDRVRLDLPPDTATTVILRVAPNSFGIYPLFWTSARAPDYQEYQPFLPRGVYFNVFIFGVTFIVLVYHLLLFAFLRDAVYGWFALWLAFATITHGMTTGLEPAFWLGLTGESSRFLLWLIVPNCMLFSFWWFGRSFVSSRERFPVLDKFMLALPVLHLLVVFSGVAYLQLASPVVFMTMFGYHYEMLATLAVLGIGVGVALLTKPDTLARIFGVGVVLGCSFILVGTLWSLRLIRVPLDPYATSVIVQILVYSLGLAYRRARKRREQMAAELVALQDRNEVARMRDLEDVKSRFFANVSHEFRTPLTLIAGPLELAKERRNHLEERGPVILPDRDVRVMQSGVERLRKLVEQLLALSKLESGQTFLRLKKGGVVAFVRQLALSFSSMAERDNVSLDTTFPDEMPEGFYDADKLETIFVNLLANAIKYAPARGRVSVRMTLEPQHFCVEVTDNGPGIPADQLDQIFDRFYRVDGTGVEGSGIGLALTKELVDVYGGTISVRSELGRGTTFRLRLPATLDSLPRGVTAAPEANAESVPHVVAPGSTASHEGILPDSTDAEQACVLIVEDSPELREFIGNVLEGTYRVIDAHDGEAGERMALEHLPDVIISDVMMPGKDGFALCHSLKTNPKTSHIPFILLTAKADRESTLSGLNQGADDYLAKPFDPRELRLRVRNLLEARESLWRHFQSLDLTLLPDVDQRSIEDQFLQQVIGQVKQRLGDESLSVEGLAREVGYSRSQLTRKLKALTGKTPNKLIAEMRLQEARRLLQKRTGTVSEVAYAVGFTNLSYFAKSFREQFGALPSTVLEEAGQ